MRTTSRLTVSAIAASIALALSTAAFAAPAPVAQTTGDSGFVATCVSPIDPGTNQQAPCAPNSLGHAQATGGGAFAGGEYSTASGTYSTAVGSASTTASGWGSVALGVSDIASGAASVALGDASYATTANSIAIGQSAAAGNAATPGAGGEIAIGGGSSAMGQGATAIGAASDASGAQSTAVGAGALATQYGSTAIGVGSNANGAFSVALGAGSVANRTASVSVGDAATGLTRQITNVADGTAPTDAANVSQVQQAEAGAINTSENYTNSALAPIDGQISALGLAVSQLSNRLNGLGASEQASAQMAMACAGDRNCLAAGWGDQSGQGAVAVGFRHQVFQGRAAWTAGVSSSDAGTSVGVGFAINLH